ncbi:hypothetical protein [Serratia odorifera]|jgi:hypothetical protein|uniref:hypothetical protein n=1 Tax=Serratia odorifera TaxID=618 RepID=UPI000FD75973|nr:hypothetical protein [Serratia odorifera]MBJ2067373.1 hypothetical protein [Serratia odorifera]
MTRNHTGEGGETQGPGGIYSQLLALEGKSARFAIGRIYGYGSTSFENPSTKSSSPTPYRSFFLKVVIKSLRFSIWQKPLELTISAAKQATKRI